MRIIAGEFKGFRLKHPKVAGIRPTSDRVREYIFSCIQMGVVDSTVLDLFAGTGALGIEALSRGAASATFVDNSAASIALIKENLERVQRSATVHRRRAGAYLKYADQTFDFIFCDPPYDYDDFSAILQLIVDQKTLTKNAVFIYESSARQMPPEAKGLKLTRQKKLGDTLITFYQEDYESSSLSRNI